MVQCSAVISTHRMPRCSPVLAETDAGALQARDLQCTSSHVADDAASSAPRWDAGASRATATPGRSATLAGAMSAGVPSAHFGAYRRVLPSAPEIVQAGVQASEPGNTRTATTDAESG